MDTGMSKPAIDSRRDQEGFIIIEVLVSAIILALVGGAVLTLITATTRGAASQRDRAVAYDLAQADQARMRTMQITVLNGLEQLNGKSVALNESPTELNGTVYRIESKGEFVNNQAGGASCTAENDTPDYIQVTSTVTSPAMNSPVTIESVVSPSTGSLDTTHGNLSVQANNAAGKPVSGVSVLLKGPTSYGRTTESQGCANFADIPNGEYTITFKGGTLVNPKGKTEEEVKVNISGKTTEHKTSEWDKPGKLEPEFVYAQPGTGTLLAAPVDSMSVALTERSFGPTAYGTPGGARSARPVAEKLFPFHASKYTVYAGSCSSNNPNPSGSKTENNVGIGSIEVLPEGIGTARIQVPALELTVENGSKPLAGAKVTVTDENSGCKSGSNPVKRTFTTNSGGHLAFTEIGATEAGLPFGIYKICASKKIGTTTLRAELTKVSVENFTSAGTVKALPLTTAGSECT
jgi:type II secretory pathway pseudopilin PulG